MRRYETIFILRPNAGEDEITRVIDSTTQIIVADKGTIIEQNRWGMKKLAYLIKKETLGYYVYLDYAGTPGAVAEMERKFRIDDIVLKYLTVKTASAITEDQIQQAIVAASNRKAIVEDEEGDANDREDDGDDEE